MNNKVKFLRGTATEYEASTKDNDTFYYTTDTNKLYLGANEVTGVGKAGTGANAEIFNEASEASGTNSHAEGYQTTASGNNSHAEGNSTHKAGNYVTSESSLDDIKSKWKFNKFMLASGTHSHAEGENNLALNVAAHAEGGSTIASGSWSHAEGGTTEASGRCSHAEGEYSQAIGANSHAGGYSSIAKGKGAFAHGIEVEALNNESEIAFGSYNKSNADTLFSIGNGNGIYDADRSNAFEITKTTGKLFDKEIATKEDIPTSLPANGGNADTVDGLHANEIASNPNLLINPDFRINQRGYQIYHAHGGHPSTETEKYNADYLVDGWKFIYGGETAEITDDGIVLTLGGNQGVKQPIDSKLLKSLGGKIVSFSIDWELVSGNYANFYFNNKSVSSYDTGRQKLHFTNVIPDDISDIDDYFCAISGDGIIKVYSVKMEVGSIATPFVPPDPATELAKCQRYYYSTYQGVPAGTPASYANELVLNAISANRFNHTTIDFPTTMRTTPTVKFFDPVTGEEGYACKSGTNEKVPVAIIIAGQDRVNFGSSGLTVGADYCLHYTASAEL